MTQARRVGAKRIFANLTLTVKHLQKPGRAHELGKCGRWRRWRRRRHSDRLAQHLVLGEHVVLHRARPSNVWDARARRFVAAELWFEYHPRVHVLSSPSHKRFHLGLDPRSAACARCCRRTTRTPGAQTRRSCRRTRLRTRGRRGTDWQGPAQTAGGSSRSLTRTSNTSRT